MAKNLHNPENRVLSGNLIENFRKVKQQFEICISLTICVACFDKGVRLQDLTIFVTYNPSREICINAARIKRQKRGHTMCQIITCERSECC